MSMNQVCMMGRLTRDPEIKTSGDFSVAHFSIAVDRDYKTKDGERETDFFDIVAFRGTALFVEKYFKKGQLVAVSGRIETRSWTGKDGTTKRGVEIVAGNVYFAEGKKSSEGGGKAAQAASDDVYEGFATLDEDEEDIPF